VPTRGDLPVCQCAVARGKPHLQGKISQWNRRINRAVRQAFQSDCQAGKPDLRGRSSFGRPAPRSSEAGQTLRRCAGFPALRRQSRFRRAQQQRRLGAQE
jgi:hypothetical protein